MFMPDMVTKIAGLDFDIDKVRGFFLGSQTDIISKPGEAFEYTQVGDSRQDTILELMMAVLSSPTSLKEQLTPGGFDNLKNNNLLIRAYKAGIENPGIDTEEKFNPKEISVDTVVVLRSKLNLNPKDKIVGYVGRLVKDKGIDDLIIAWGIVEMKYPDAKLLLVGPIEERDSISDYSKNKIKENSSIIFTDFVNDTSPYFSLMDIFILPTYREGFPTVALEASSMNLPVIITKATGCTEAILENETGLFISNNPKDIASKIIFYLDNGEFVVRHGVRGRLFVQENFEQTKIWTLILKILKL